MTCKPDTIQLGSEVYYWQHGPSGGDTQRSTSEYLPALVVHAGVFTSTIALADGRRIKVSNTAICHRDECRASRVRFGFGNTDCRAFSRLRVELELAP